MENNSWQRDKNNVKLDFEDIKNGMTEESYENHEDNPTKNKVLIFILAVFPLTGAFGVYSFLANNHKLKKVHQFIDMFIAFCLVVGFCL